MSDYPPKCDRLLCTRGPEYAVEQDSKPDMKLCEECAAAYSDERKEKLEAEAA